jgi:aspartyl/asparaginyl-tRNA synthetase
MVFMELRQQTDTIQAILTQSGQVSKQMLKFTSSINPESIVLIKGTIKKSPEEIKEIKATTVKDAELHIAQVHIIFSRPS